MRIPDWLLLRLKRWEFQTRKRRGPDFTVERQDGTPYLYRWYIVPRNRFCNVYLHYFTAPDDDRALHDHPWVSFSILLRGKYIEERIEDGGTTTRTEYREGQTKFRGATYTHRIDLEPMNAYAPSYMAQAYKGCATLFITGPKVREWGFHCRNHWRHWKKFVQEVAPGKTLGCGEE